MARWRWMRNYRSSLAIGALGDEAEFEDAIAEAINRDSPGALTPIVEQPAPKTSAPRSASTRTARKAGDE